MSINNNNYNIYDVYVDIFKFGCYLKRKYTFFYQKIFFCGAHFHIIMFNDNVDHKKKKEKQT